MLPADALEAIFSEASLIIGAKSSCSSLNVTGIFAARSLWDAPRVSIGVEETVWLDMIRAVASRISNQAGRDRYECIFCFDSNVGNNSTVKRLIVDFKKRVIHVIVQIKVLRMCRAVGKRWTEPLLNQVGTVLFKGLMISILSGILSRTSASETCFELLPEMCAKLSRRLYKLSHSRST